MALLSLPQPPMVSFPPKEPLERALERAMDRLVEREATDEEGDPGEACGTCLPVSRSIPSLSMSPLFLSSPSS